jgi:hypothetical protein
MRERELSKRSLRARITRIDSAGLECEKVANAIIACGDGWRPRNERAWENKVISHTTAESGFRFRFAIWEIITDNRIRASAVSRKDNKICLRVRTKSLRSFFIVSLSILLSLFFHLDPPCSSFPLCFFAHQIRRFPFVLLRPSSISLKRAVGLTLRPLDVNADINPSFVRARPLFLSRPFSPFQYLFFQTLVSLLFRA